MEQLGKRSLPTGVLCGLSFLLALLSCPEDFSLNTLLLLATSNLIWVAFLSQHSNYFILLVFSFFTLERLDCIAITTQIQNKEQSWKLRDFISYHT